MHPLIAFLSFLFSPSDDWALKKGYQLLMEPQAITETAEGYQGLVKTYPTPDADPSTLMTWADILSLHRSPAAQKAWDTLLKTPSLAPALTGEIQLRLAETAFQNGDLTTAQPAFAALAATENPRQLDALTNLLLCDLRNNDAPAAKTHAAELKARLSDPTEFPRAVFPLGLAAFINGEHENALALFNAEPDQPRSQYFAGLALRAANKPVDALTAWQGIKQKSAAGKWTELADYQIAETYFALGDHALSRAACETALATHPDGETRDSLVFRLASIDMADKRYDDALAKLAEVRDRDDLKNRTTILMAESLVKTGKRKEVLAMLDKSRDERPSAETQYHLAWASLLSDKNSRAFDEAEKGLENFYDTDVTPRLLLLEGIALEKENNEAAALATYQTIADRFPASKPAAQATHWLTLAYMRLGRYQEALTHSGYLWKNLPDTIRRDTPETAYWLGEAAQRLDRADEADRYYDAFLTMAAPDHDLTPFAQFERAAVLAKMNKTQEAVTLLAEFSKSAEKLGRKEWTSLAHLQQGHMLYNDRQYEKAVAAYRQSGDSPKSLYQQGLALYRLDYFTDATDAWTKLASLYPNDALSEDALFRVGRTQFEMGKAPEAVASFATYINTYPDSPRVKEAMLQSAHALYNAGDFAGAAPLYAAYLARFRSTDDMVTVTPYLAACHAQTGTPLAEVETAMKGLPPTETLASLQWTEGAKSYNEKNYDQAVNQFGGMLSALPTGENTRNALFYRSESLYLGHKWFDAEKGFGNYLAGAAETPDANAPTALFHQAIAVYQQDHLLDAAKIFERFLAQNPTHPLAKDAKENLALCYYNIGDFQTAERVRSQYNITPDEAPAAPAESPRVVEVDPLRTPGWKTPASRQAAVDQPPVQ
jgi:TolA-binding protein